MASVFCSSCGAPANPGAQFCASCGSPLGPTPGTGPLPAGPGTPPTVPVATFPAQGAGSAFPPPAPAPGFSPQNLSAQLGLAGRRNFLVQHQILSLGHSYRVLDAEKNHLFTVQGDAGQNLASNALGSVVGSFTNSSYLQRVAARSTNMTYSIVDRAGTVQGTLRKEGGANASTFTLVDLSGQPQVVVSLQRGLMGGITATAVSPDGRPMLQTHGNLLRHSFFIQDAAGANVAKVHEAWVAIRDTYNIDLLGSIDPLFPLVYSVLIDFEKVK